MRRLFFFAVSSAACCYLSAPAYAQMANEDMLVRILKDWKNRQDRIHSIHWKVSGTQFNPKGRWDEDYRYGDADDKELLKRKGSIPDQDKHLPVNFVFLLELDKNWARKEMQWMVLHRQIAEFVPHHTTHLYNGERVKVYEPREKNTSNVHTPGIHQPDLWIQTDRFASSAFFANEDLPLFWACGIVETTLLSAKKMKPSLAVKDFVVWGKGEIDGRKCVVLRTRGAPKSYEYWVDLDRESSIVRGKVYYDAQNDFQIDVQYQLQGEIWLPLRWKHTRYWWKPQAKTPVIDFAFQLQVDKVTLNPTIEHSDFDVELRPKMVVRDVEKNTVGVVAADSKTLLPLSAIESDRPIRPIWAIVLVVGVIALVVTSVWFLRRKWARSVTV